jgi:hypothetical protein
MRWIILILLILLFAACATDNFYWEHPVKGPDAYYDDAAVCNVEAQRAKGEIARDLQGVSYAEEAAENAYDKAFEDCIEIKGWFKVKY